jgi:hypothetical protein
VSDLANRLRREARQAMAAAIDQMSPKAAYQLGYAAALQEAAQDIANEGWMARIAELRNPEPK